MRRKTSEHLAPTLCRDSLRVPRLGTYLLSLLAVVIGCGEAKSPVPPPQHVTTRPHEGDEPQASVTLSAEAQDRLAIATAPIEERPFPRLRVLPGEVIAPPGRTVLLSASLPSLVVAPEGLPTPGTRVRDGQELARLVPLAAVDRDLRAQAKRGVAAAEARLNASRSRAERAERLIASGAGSERASEEARADRDVANAEHVAAKARLRMIERSPLSADVTTPLRAPYAAIVRQVQVADGQAVAAGAGLIELVADEPPWVRIPIPSAELGTLEGLPATIAGLSTRRDDATPTIATSVPGPPFGDPLAGTVDVYLQLPDASSYRLGERVSATWQVAHEELRLVLPVTAIVRDPSGGAWVYVDLGDGRFDRQRIEIAAVVGDFAALSRAPDVGTKIVTIGASELYGAEFGAGH